MSKRLKQNLKYLLTKSLTKLDRLKVVRGAISWERLSSTRAVIQIGIISTERSFLRMGPFQIATSETGIIRREVTHMEVTHMTVRRIDTQQIFPGAKSLCLE